MPFYFKPHSPEWFQALEAFDPRKASITRMAIEFAGSFEVCSLCGDDPARDYQLVDEFMEDNAVATIRLCDDCLGIKRKVHNEKLVPLSKGESHQFTAGMPKDKSSN
jgi:hypothetical protein